MRTTSLLLPCALLSLSMGCSLGGKSRTGLASAPEERPRETWNTPRFAGSDGASRGRDASPSRTLERAHEAARNEQFDVAADLYEQVLESQPTNPAAHHGLAIIADRNGDFARAEEHYLTALRGRSADADLLNDVGYSYLMQGRTGEAEELLERALEAEPRHALATSNLGHLRARTGRYDEAFDLFCRVGTESQARAELARYTSGGREAAPEESIATGDPARRAAGEELAAAPTRGLSEEDWAKLSPERIRDLMDAERRRAISERDERDRAIAARDEWGHEASDREPGRVPVDFAPPGEAFVRQGTRDPVDPAWPGRDGVAANGGERPLPAGDPRLAEAVSPARANGAEIVPIGFEEGLPPWPGDAAQPRSMGNRMPNAVPLREDWGSEPAPMQAGSPTVAGPNDAHRRAALLGLNAGQGMLLPLDAGQAIRPGVPGGGPAGDASAFGPPVRSPSGTPTGTPPSVRPPAETWPESMGTWPESAAVAPGDGRSNVQPIATTSPVPADPSLYRGADGSLYTVARPETPAGDDEFAAARWAADPRYRHEISERDADRRRLEERQTADRLAFQGGGPAHGGFDPGFGPPTVTPQPRIGEERAMPVYGP